MINFEHPQGKTHLLLLIAIILNILGLFSIVIYNETSLGIEVYQYYDAMNLFGFLILLGGIGLNFLALQKSLKENVQINHIILPAVVLILIPTFVVQAQIDVLNGSVVDYNASQTATPGKGILFSRIATIFLLIAGIASLFPSDDKQLQSKPEKD
ncbi:MAG: hypothetical protein INQ03_12305 [Candidatus Heimdallarchaeota archaeon]|nr:hypothetical protein [Candidatus Heimdallarchaeota archaeon]